jgi:hypothetical protein
MLSVTWVCGEYNMTMHKELEQSSVCVKMFKGRPQGRVRAQACGEFY